MSVSIYHNPRCGKSRETLALIRESGVEPEIILYLETPPSKKRLKELIAALGTDARGLMRKKEKLYRELGLDDPKLSQAALIDAMIANPILIERPIVATKKGVRLGRPPEAVREVL